MNSARNFRFARRIPSWRPLLVALALFAVSHGQTPGQQKEKLYLDPLDIEPRPIAKDNSVKYDFDVVYVRAPRPAGKSPSHWAEVGDPRTMDPGAALMLLHPDGTEEVLVPVQPHESIAAPFVSFDGQWVYYA